MGGWRAISPGELFKKEIAKKSETGKRIQQCWNEYHYGKSLEFIKTLSVINFIYSK